MAGGSIFDDFNGDGLLDVFTSTADPTRGASCSSTAAMAHLKTGPKKQDWLTRSPRSTVTRPTMTMTATLTST